MSVRRNPEKRPRPPATTPERQEQRLTSLAVSLAERQLLDGTASAQVITHYLKMGSTRERLEQNRLAQENELLKAKVDQLSSAKRTEELYEDALNAMRAYSGQDGDSYDS